MRNPDIDKRLTERTAYCRGCDEAMPKGTPCISTYSRRNRGQYIYFCVSCADFIGRIA